MKGIRTKSNSHIWDASVFQSPVYKNDPMNTDAYFPRPPTTIQFQCRYSNSGTSTSFIQMRCVGRRCLSCPDAQSKQRYRLSGILSGHGAAINCMSFLQEDMLASGGNLRVFFFSQFHLTPKQAMTRRSVFGTSGPKK